MSDKAQIAKQIEAEAICLKVEAGALENEAHDPNSFQKRLKDFEDKETVPCSPNLEICKGDQTC